MRHCISSGLALLFMLCFAPAVFANQTESSVQLTEKPSSALKLATPGRHGGAVRRHKTLIIETVVTHAGIRLYFFGPDNRPVAATKIRGIVSVRAAGDAKRYRYDLLPDGKGSLTSLVNLTRYAGRQLEMNFHLIQLPLSTADLRFRQIAKVPPTKEQQTALAIARQKTCPVSGKPLGSMGVPLVVDLDGQAVYLCCQGCTKKLKADPQRYLDELKTGDREQPAIPTQR